MNPIPTTTLNRTRIMPARRRSARLVHAVMLVTAAAIGAVSCTDSSVTEPLVRNNPLAGMPASFDSATAPELKEFNQLASSSVASKAAPLFSASAAAASAPGASVTAIPFAPVTGTFANVLPGCDDCFYGPYDINFNFRFFGNTYSKFYVSTNGFVTFEPIGKDPTGRVAGCCKGRSLPVADEINNLIALAWGDLSTQGVSRGLSFETRGSAPNRRLIVNFAGAKDLNASGKTVTAQLILFEGSNDIEIHTANAAGMLVNRTQGVENRLGSEALAVAGRVATRFALTNDAVRFSGLGGNSIPVALPGGNAGSGATLHYEGVEGAAIQFTGSGSDADKDPLTYSWDFNNDGTVDASSAAGSFTFPDNGAFKAKLTVDDGNGGIGEALVDVVVSNAKPVVDAGADAQIIAGQTVDYSGHFSDAGLNDSPWGWTWNLGSLGNFSGTTTEQAAAIPGSHRYCKSGSYTAQFTVVDKDGGSGTDAFVVTVDAQPIQIDINPEKIVLNDNGNAMVTVRMFSSADFDATSVNPSSVKLTNGSGRGTTIARTGGGLLHWNADEDLNGDGRLDVMVKFRRDELLANGDIQMNTTELSLKGDLNECGEVLGKAPVQVKVKPKNSSAASAMDTPDQNP